MNIQRKLTEERIHYSDFHVSKMLRCQEIKKNNKVYSFLLIVEIYQPKKR